MTGRSNRLICSEVWWHPITYWSWVSADVPFCAMQPMQTAMIQHLAERIMASKLGHNSACGKNMAQTELPGNPYDTLSESPVVTEHLYAVQPMQTAMIQHLAEMIIAL